MLRVFFSLILLFLVGYPVMAIGSPRFAPIGTEVRISYPGVYCTNKEALIAVYEQRSNDFERGQYELLAHGAVCAMPPAGQEIVPRARIEGYEMTWTHAGESFALARVRWTPTDCENDFAVSRVCRESVIIYVLVPSIGE